MTCSKINLTYSLVRMEITTIVHVVIINSIDIACEIQTIIIVRLLVIIVELCNTRIVRNTNWI